MKNNIEILAPAGSLDTLYAGINAGADAIYIGGTKFGARAYADNPDEYNLLQAIDYVHFNNRKIYLTVNTLIKNNEIEEQLYDYIYPLYKQGLDAVIVQDLGVFEFIRNNFRDLDIHASTQMAVSGVESAKLLKKMGASRVVTARELSLMELNNIHNNVDIEIESFIHGAMCYSYSGMCLFSSMIGGRSGNRGRCAGPCRQPYEVYMGGKRINNENNLYALSLRDMNTLEIIPEIIDSGVFSLKIEGRMKSPEYCAGVVSIYRKYVDLFFEKGKDNYRIDKNDMRNLSDLYSRSGSTTGYYKTHNSRNMISLQKPAYKTENMDFINEINSRYCNGRRYKNVNADIKLKSGKNAILTIYTDDMSVTETGNKVDDALNRPIDKENVIKQLNKTGESLLKFQKINIEMDDNIFIPVKQLNELRRSTVTKFEEKFLAGYRKNIDNYNCDCTGNYKEKVTDKPDIKEVNTNIICMIYSNEQLSAVLEQPEIKDIYVCTDMLDTDECIEAVNKVSDNGKSPYIVLPAVFRQKDKAYIDNLLKKISGRISGVVIKNIDELGYADEKLIENIYIDNSLYSFNDYAYEYLKKMKAKRITLPFELNYKELRRLAKEDNELVVYGKIPLMITANCINNTFSGCDRKAKDVEIKDRLGINFNVFNCCNFCYNIIFNNVPLSLLDRQNKIKCINTANLRLNFTTEDYKQTKYILEKYVKVFYYNEYSDEIKEFTRGHFNRGVE